LIKLIGILIVILGLAFRFNSLLVVIVAGFATGFAGGMSPVEILDVIGSAFVTNRYMSLFILILPVIGLLERYGLREQAGRFIRSFKGTTAGRIMIIYMLFRQITVGLGMMLGGHPSFIRPIVSPMAEAAVAKGRPMPQKVVDEVRGFAASADNYGNFYGQLIFLAAGGLLLIKGVMEQAGYEVSLTTMAVYAIPTAVIALLIAAVQYHLFDCRMERLMQESTQQDGVHEGRNVQ
jgi:uncharacterized membrane protein